MYKHYKCPNLADLKYKAQRWTKYNTLMFQKIPAGAQAGNIEHVLIIQTRQ